MLEGFQKMTVTSGAAFLSISNNATAFNRASVLKLNRATHICFFINNETKQIAVQACDKDTEDAIAFVKRDSQVQNGVRFNSRDLQNTLAGIMQWDIENFNYRIDGVYDEQEKALIFDLTKARPLQKKNMGKK